MEQPQSELEQLATRLIADLKAQSLKIASAESCTGGWIAKALTDIAGSSTCFDGGVVSYSNQVKQDLLKVPVNMLEQHGAVSAEVVAAMAEGACDLMNADISIATSGIAGPGGGSEAKPVGTVFFAIAQNGREILTWKALFSGDREAVRKQAVREALSAVSKALKTSQSMG